jgi:hypothetical protein
MGSMKEFESSSTLFGSNVPFIEELYEHYLADANAVSPDGGRTSMNCAKGRPTSRMPVIASFVELARNRKVAGAMVDAETMQSRCSCCGSSAIPRLECSHDLDHCGGTTAIPADLDLRTYGFTEADLTTDSTSARSDGPARMRWPSSPRSNLHAHDRHRYMCIWMPRPALAATAGADPRQGALFAGRAPPPGAPRRGNAGTLPAHEICRPEASRARGPDDDPDARPAHREGGRVGVRNRAGHGASRTLNVLVNTLGKIRRPVFGI